MSAAGIVWAQFALCVIVIGIAGVKLTIYGDAIADKTGMGGSWIGLILIATVTSLPELATGITASTIALVPDIAVGDVMGACVYNLLILAVLDLFTRRQPVLSLARRHHVVSAAFSMILIGLAAIGLIAAQAGVSGLAGHIAWSTPLLILAYIAAIRTLHGFREKEVEEFTDEEPDAFPDRSLREIGMRYAIAAAFVVAAGIWLPFISEDLSHVMGWHQSFTGTIFTAFSTTVPELVVTLTALRIGAIDMALGNVLGSNLFNMLILAIADLVYLPGSIYADVSMGHLVSGITAMTMSAAVVAALYLRPRRRVLGIGGWASPALIALFALNTWLMYRLGVDAV